VALYGFLTSAELLPMLVFVAIMAGTFWLLSLISTRNSQAEDRLDRIGRPKSLVDIEMSEMEAKNRFGGMADKLNSLGAAMEPQSELERNSLRVKLANAGFRSENAPAIYQGMRVASLALFLIPAAMFFLVKDGFTLVALQGIVVCGGAGF
jgi:tight adherence protein C